MLDRDTPNMRLLDLVATSASVAAVSGRLEKIGRLAAVVERLEPGEVGIAIPFLSGATRQGRLGVGHAAIAASSDVSPADEATLTLPDVDGTFQTLADAEGKGSSG